MQKRNIKTYIREVEETLKLIRKEEFKINNDKYYGALGGDILKELYLKEQYYEGQLFACNYILKNC